MGGNDTRRNHIRGIHRTDAGYHQCRAGLLEGGGGFMYYHDGSDVVLGRAHGNRGKCGDHRERLKKDPPSDPFSLSEPSLRAFGGGAYHDEYHRQCTGAWMGGDTCGIEGDGGARETGGGQKGGQASRAGEKAGDCEQ